MNKVIIAGKEFSAEVAITDEEQQRGLMYKHPPVPVMAFPFKQSKITKFWMKNTYSPLDILFCNKGKIVSCYYGVPLSEKMVGPDSPTDMVIEFPAGTVDKLGAKNGDSVLLKMSIKSLARWYSCTLNKSS